MSFDIQRICKFAALLAVSAFAASSCEKSVDDVDVPSGGNGPIIINESPRALRGELIIKIKPESAATKATGSIGDALSGTMEVSEILAKNGKFKLERLFPECGRFEARTKAEGLDSWYVATFDKSLETSDVVRQLRSCGSVECIEYSLPIVLKEPAVKSSLPPFPSQTKSVGTDRKATFPFNEPADVYTRQWHYYNTGAVYAKSTMAGADADVWPAWDIETGNPDVIVAVIDQGVKYDHEDLADNMWVNSGEIPGNGIDDDNNGYVDDIYGYNFVDNKGGITTSASLSHGTHVAGTIAAVNNNGKGVNGIAGGSGKGDGVRIMTLQSLGASESGTSGAGLGGIVRAMKYAADNGAVICQNSWGYSEKVSWNTWTRSSFSALRRAMDYFIKYAGVDENGNQTGPMKGGIIIFAAGNESVSHLTFPAADDKVISVSSFAYDGAAAYYTNYGEWVSLAAPGGDTYLDSSYGGVYSTIVGEDGSSSYGYMQGTSMACPHVSGACALAVSHYYGADKRKGLTPDMLKEALLSSTRPINPYLSSVYSGKMGIGMVDCYNLLRYMDYFGDIDAVTVAKGGSTEVDLTDKFPSVQVLGFTVEDPSIVSAEINRAVLTVKGLKTGKTVIKVNDGKAMYKSLEVTVK